MFRRAHAPLAALIFSAVALTACDRAGVTEAAKPADVANQPVITDSILKTLYGTLHVVYQPAVDGDSSATSLMFAYWNLEIADGQMIRLAGSGIGEVPALDGAAAFVTGRMANEQLVVESYALAPQGTAANAR